MKPMSIFQHRNLICLLFVFQYLACERNYDAPPSEIAQALSPDLSIKDLRAKHVMGKFEQLTNANTIVGVIVANDQSDNFYKSIILQDTTGGITIRMDGIKLNANYPIGRKIAIHLKGLWLGDYGKMIQLGSGVDLSDPAYPSLFPIPQTLFDQYIIKGEASYEPKPIVLNVTQLGNQYQSRLIQLNQVTFALSDTAKPFADTKNKESLNRTLIDCNGNSILLRTSGYASFGGSNTPVLLGSIKGIYSVFGSTKQLVIRDLEDVQMNQPRCK